MENQNIVYGRLLANIDIGGFCFERMVSQLKELLVEDKWKKIHNDFKTKGDFINSLKLSGFKISIEQRKELAKLLVEEESISQRTTARMLGVDHVTIGRDLKSGEKSPPDEDIDTEYQEVENDSGEKSPPPEKNPARWLQENYPHRARSDRRVTQSETLKHLARAYKI